MQDKIDYCVLIDMQEGLKIMATYEQVHSDGSEHDPRMEVFQQCIKQPYAKYSQLRFTDLTRGEWQYWTKKLQEEEILKSKWMGRGCYAWRGYALSDKILRMMRS